MKTIQIKIDKNITNFNDEVEVISFMANRLAKKRASNGTYNPKITNEVKRMNVDSQYGSKMTIDQFKKYLLNA
jgi:hypothetical protein